MRERENKKLAFYVQISLKKFYDMKSLLEILKSFLEILKFIKSTEYLRFKHFEAISKNYARICVWWKMNDSEF